MVEQQIDCIVDERLELWTQTRIVVLDGQIVDLLQEPELAKCLDDQLVRQRTSLQTIQYVDQPPGLDEVAWNLDALRHYYLQLHYHSFANLPVPINPSWKGVVVHIHILDLSIIFFAPFLVFHNIHVIHDLLANFTQPG